MTETTRDNGDSKPGASDPDRLAKLLGAYVDRLNAREALDEDTILAEQPDLGRDLIRELQFFRIVPATEEPSESLGTVGDYVLRRQIGRGGMGVVYDAWENSMDRRVALKVLPAGIAADTRSFTRFCREAKLAGKLHHPNIVPVFGMGIKEDTPHYAMEYVEGETLSQVLDRLKAAGGEKNERQSILKGLSEIFGRRRSVGSTEGTAVDAATDSGEEAVKIASRDRLAIDDATPEYAYQLARAFAGVAEGLQHAHVRGIVHRDIKPSNLILDPDGRLRILDFGLARQENQDSLTISGDLLGTVLYMSPEQAMARRIPIDHRTDLYSLGASLYEMLVLRPPFEGKNHQDTLSKIILQEPTAPTRINARVPRDLETITMKCLRKDPGERYSTAEALAQDLRRFVRGDPIEARPQGAWPRTVRRMRRHRLALTLAGIVLVIAALLAELLVTNYRVEVRKRVAVYEQGLRDIAARIQLNALTMRAAKGEAVEFDPASNFTFFGLDQFVAGTGRDALERTIEELGRLEAQVPGRPDAAFLRARILTLLDRDDEALRHLDRALARDPEYAAAQVLRDALSEKSPAERASGSTRRPPAVNGDARIAAWMAARTASVDRNWTAAAEAYGRWLRAEAQRGELYPGSSVEARLGRGHARFASGDFWGAVEDLSHAKERWPHLIEPAILLARTYRKEGHKDLADRVLREAYERAPNKVLAASWIALFYERFHEYSRGLEWARKLPSRLIEFVFCLRDGRHEDLLRLAARMRHEEPNRPDILLHEGMAHFKTAIAMGPTSGGFAHFEEALEKASTYLERAPDAQFAHTFLANLRLLQGNLQETKRLLREQEARTPAEIAWRAHIAAAYYGERHWNDALHYFQAAQMRQRGTLLPLSMCVADALWRLGRREEAIKTWQESTKKEGVAFYAHWLLSSVYLEEGKLEKASASLAQALKLGPNSWRTYRNLTRGFLEHGGSWCGSELEQAMRRLERDLDPVGASCLWDKRRTLALWRLYSPSRRNLDAALEHAEAGVTLSNQGNPELLEVLARVQFARGEPRRAVVALEQAVHLDGALLRQADLLEEYRAALRPDLVSFASADAAFEALGSGEQLQRLLDDFRGLDPQGQSNRVAIGDYLEARVRQASGDFTAAADTYARLMGDAAESNVDRHFLPRRAACLREGGQSAKAAEELFGFVSDRGAHSRALWNLWLQIEFADLAAHPGVLLARLPARKHDDASDTSPEWDPADDIRWLIETLAADRPLRISCGADDALAAPCPGWTRDRFFNRGEHNKKPPFYDIANTDVPTVYRTHRWFHRDRRRGSYAIPLPPGHYRVNLHFAEIWFRESGERQFDIRLNGNVVEKAFEPLRTGFATAEVLSFDVEVTDGILSLEFVARRNNPMISGLEITRASELKGPSGQG